MATGFQSQEYIKLGLGGETHRQDHPLLVANLKDRGVPFDGIALPELSPGSVDLLRDSLQALLLAFVTVQANRFKA